MLYFDLRSAMDAYEAKTGMHLTYSKLSSMTDVSVSTLKSIATRDTYNTTLAVLSQISEAMNLNPIDYFYWIAKHDSSR